MRFRRTAIAAALMAGMARPAAAQIHETIFEDLKHGVVDILSVWASPFRGDGSDYLTAGLVTGGVGVVALFDREIGRWIRDNQSAAVLEVLTPFRERDSQPKLVNLGAGLSLDQIGGTLWLLGLITDSRDLRDAGIGCVVAEKSNGIPRRYIYTYISRERPLYMEVVDGDTIVAPRLGDPYDIDVPNDTDNWFDNSFFGGHGANIMSCASFMNHRFDLGIAEPIIWTVAIGVNVGRMADERHWASDAAIGAVLGYAIGRYIAERQRKRLASERAQEQRGTPDRSALEVVVDGLYVGGERGALTVGWRGKTGG